jgi:predicted dehydrogenase
MLTTGGSRAQSAAERFGIKQLFNDPESFFSFKDIDAYVVVVPVQFIKSVSMQALSTGKPVLMEKPPGVSAHDTAELLECANRNRTFGMVCMNRRFYSVLEHGLAALADCGPIRGITAEIPQPITAERQSRRLSAFVHDHFFIAASVHGVDLVRYVLGDPLHVHSLVNLNADKNNAGASFASILEYPSGVVATITDLWDTPEVWRAKIIAEMGWIEFEGLERGWFVNSGGEKTPIMRDRVDLEFRPGVYAQDLHFIEAVRRGKPPLLPACLLPDAHKTMDLMERILRNSLGSLSGVPLG